MNIVLIGYRGCGKTAVGWLIAQRLGWAMVDTDALIEQASGQTIRDIYQGPGQEAFRDWESRVVAEVARTDAQVISTGGGVVLRKQNTALLKETGKLVWLTAPAEVLWERILADASRTKSRPPADLAHGLEIIKKALVERNPIYQQATDLIVDTTGRSCEEVAGDILSQLKLTHSTS